MENLGMIMGGYSSAEFKGDDNEYCSVVTYYIRNTKKIEVVFKRPGEQVAYKPAIISTSEKRIVKMLKEYNFKRL